MTKSFKKRLNKALSIVLAVAMLVGTLPADLLGGIASVSAAEEAASAESVTYSFMDESIIPSTTSGGATYTSEDGKLTAATGNKNGFGTDAWSSHGITFKEGNTITISVSGKTTIEVGTCTYSTAKLIATVGNEVLAEKTFVQGTEGQGCYTSNKSNVFTVEYTGTGDADVVLTVSDNDDDANTTCKIYIPEIVVTPKSATVDGNDVSNNDSEKETDDGSDDGNDKIDIWDFDGEADADIQEDLAKAKKDRVYNLLTLNEVLSKAVYPDVEVGTKDSNLKFNTFTIGDLTFVGGSSTGNRLRSTNTALSRRDDTTMTTGENKEGYIYSNSSGNTYYYDIANVREGDIITFHAGPTGTETQDATFDYQPANGETDVADVVIAHTAGKNKTQPYVLYASKAGTYRFWGTGKLGVTRVTRQHCAEVGVTGTVTGDVPTSAFSVLFTCVESGAEIEAPVSAGKYTATLRAGYNYKLSLVDANGYIVKKSDSTLAIEADATAVTKNIVLQAVDLVTVAGTITVDGEVNAEVLGAAEAFVLTPASAESIYVPEFEINTTTGVYSVQVEKSVSYTLSVKGINDYEIKSNTWQFAEDKADEVIAITKKPVYKVTIVPEVATLEDLASATFAFTNLGRRTGCEDDEGYSYEFVGPDAIELRDGVYSVEVKNSAPYKQKLTSNVVVNGAAVEKKIAFVKDSTVVWDFQSDEFTGQADYNGLLFAAGEGGSFKKHGPQYGLSMKNGTITVPVSGNCTVKVYGSYTWDVAFPGKDAEIQKTANSTGTMIYSYVGEAGTVVITIGGNTTTYLSKIEVTDPLVAYKETITVGADKEYQTINDALDAISKMERTADQRVTVMIDPGDYEEMLRVTQDNVTLKNASATPSIALKNSGVDIDENAVRITSYYGHGYTYYSMNSDCLYDEELLAVNKENGYASFVNPGSGVTNNSYWNATVSINADGFEAEGIIFENSFNQYVSAKAAKDVIVAQSSAKEGSVARADLPKGSTEVQNKAYVERAAALAIYNGKTKASFDNCKFIGRQDTLYGGTGTVAAFYNCEIYGATDFIMGPITAVFAKCKLVMNTSEDSNDVAYITAAQTKEGYRGMLMWNCTVTSTQPGVDTASKYTSKAGYFGRPWSGIGEAVFYETVIDATCEKYFEETPSLIQPIGWLNTLSGESASSVEYNTHEMAMDVKTKAELDNSESRAKWATLAEEPTLPDGSAISVETFLGNWDAFAGKDMSIVVPENVGTVDNTPVPEEGTVVKSYSLVASALTRVEDKHAYEDGTKLGTEDFFEVELHGTIANPSGGEGEAVGSVVQRCNDTKVKALEIQKWSSAGIKFTVRGTADAELQVCSTGGSNYSAVALLDSEGKIVKATSKSLNTAEKAGEQADGSFVVYGNEKNPSTLVYEGLAAGTYELVSPYHADYGRGAWLVSAKVDDTVKEGDTITEFVLDGADVAAFAEGAKADGASETAGTKNFFTLLYSAKTKVEAKAKTFDDGYAATQRINFGGKATTTMDAIKFTTTKPMDVKVWWISGGDGRYMTVLNGEGKEVVKTDAVAKDGLAISTLKLTEAGTYYLGGGSTGKNYIFKVVVKEPGEEEVVRAAWDTVAAPEITSVELNPEDAGEYVVNVKGHVGVDGADKIVVELIDAKGDVVAAKDSSVDNTKDKTASLVIAPSKSGDYTFMARLVRADEADKVSEETDVFKFVLPLSAPSIKSVTNKGLVNDKGSLEVAWYNVTEARSYEVTVTKTTGGTTDGSDDGSDGSTDGKDVQGEVLAQVVVLADDDKALAESSTSALKTVITGLPVNEYVKISVVAVRKDEKSKAGTAVKKVLGEAERTWAFTSYGSSTNKANNGYFGDTKSGVTVYSESGKGKIVPGSTDGLAFYYTTIDPTTENFTMTVDVYVDEWTLSNGQEGFGIMVSDAVGELGDGTAFWNNSYQLLATKIEYNWDPALNDGKGGVTNATSGQNGIIKQSGKLGLGWISKEGTTATDVAKITAGELSLPGSFKSSSGTLETESAKLNPNGGQFNIIGNAKGAKNSVQELVNLKLQIQRNNDGYWLRYLSADGKTVIGEKLFYDDNRNNLTQIDKKNIYVGFVASRNARATFSNVQLTTINPEDDAPATEKAITYVEPSYQILSPVTSNSEEYKMVFYGNADGKLTILNDENEVVLQDAEITAKKKFTVKTKLHEGDNKFVWAFVPNADYVPGDYQKLSSYDKKVESFHVTYNKFAQDIIYVAPTGTATAAGTAEAPTDIYTAVAYASAGQKIYLAGGKYELNNVLIDRGHDGTAKKPIYLMADPAAKERPVLDFAKQTGSTSAMILAGNYWYLKGFDVTNSMNAQKGLQVSGSYNVVEDVDAYRNGNTGIQVSRYLGSDKYDEWPSYNTILNCTSYLNADAGYEDADGFAAKLTVADGNKFVGCIAAYNADDGWDLFAKVESGAIGAVTIDSCLAFKNGYMLGDNKGDTDPGNDVIDPYMTGAKEFSAGNGNGFKMGGDSMSGYHVIKNSIAFANKAKGLDSNSCPDIQLYNCTSFDNESYNVALYTNTAVNTDYYADGILSIKSKDGEKEQIKPVGSQNLAKIYSANNYYFDGSKSENSKGEKAELSWFKSTDTAAAINGGITRDANGSINMNGYLELTDKAPATTGARLGNTSADVVIETAAEVSVLAANVKTLKDIDLTTVVPGYDWADPDTETAVFAGTTTEFIVSAEGKADKAVKVNFVEITGVKLSEVTGKQTLFDGENMTLTAAPVFTPAVEVADIVGYDKAGVAISIAESSKLKLDTAKVEGTNNVTVTRGSASGEGIAKFTATLTSSVCKKQTANYQFTTRKAAAYIDYTVDGVAEKNPVSVLTVEKAALKLTATAVGLSSEAVKVAVNDAKVVKYDAASSTLTAVGEGTATVTITAAADKTVMAQFTVTVKGAELKTNVSVITVDRAKLVGAQFTALACYGTDLVDGSVVVKSIKKGKTDVKADYIALDNVVGGIYNISTTESGSGNSIDRMPTGTYTLTLAGKLTAAPEVEVEFEPVTLKVIETKPTAKIKQTKKVNLFYTAGSASGNGALTATSKQTGVTLTQNTAKDHDYKLTATKSGYSVVLKSSAASKKTKIKQIYVTVSFDGYKSSYNKVDQKITVGSVNKAPKLKLEVDNKILYTQLGINDTAIRVWDDTSKTYVTTADVALATSKTSYVKANKNFGLSKEGTEYVLVADKSGSAKISVQDADWTKEIVLSQAITVSNKKPNVTVKKLTLNNMEAFVGNEQASTVMTVKNALDYKVRNLELVGKTAKDKALLENGYLTYSVEVNDEGQNVLNVSLTDAAVGKVKKGSYSFTANFTLNKLAGLKTNVKLSVVDKVTVTTKQSGSIDLVNRLGSSVTVKPTVKNLNGKVVGMRLDKQASNQFDVEWNSTKGAAVVTVKEGIDMKKGGKYKVTPTFIVETAGENVEVVAKTITIAPKQSNLKTTKLATMEVRLSAPNVAARATYKATSPAKAEILDMVQVNELKNFAVTYDCESDTIAVKIVNSADLKANKTYKIKVELVAEGAAVNAKAQTVTIPVKVVK